MIPDYENLNAIKEFNTMFLFKQTINNKLSKDIWHISGIQNQISLTYLNKSMRIQLILIINNN